MKKNIYKRGLPIIIMSLALLSFGLLKIETAFAWGPDRTTFTMEKPASYPTFNSITNNPTIGDERNFVRVGEINTDVTKLSDEIEVVPGKQYLVYIYFHNNASSTYNDSAHNHSGIALNTRMSTSFSTVLTPAQRGTISATISADNSKPSAVWDEAYMTTSTNKVLLHYVPGSAHIYNDWNTNGDIVPSNLFTEKGVLLGLNALNGVIPGCEEYHGVVTYVLQAEELGGTIEKTVSKDGVNYKKSADIAPGEEVYYKLAIYNTGDIALSNATVKDTLPEGLTLVPGSVQLRANDDTAFDQLSDNIIGTGYNLGTIGTGNVVYITYRAVVGNDFDCVGTELINKAKFIYDSDLESGDISEDSATVTVKRTDCEEPIPQLDNCETNPSLEGCQTPNEKTCATNPEMEGCQELPNTGPVEIIMATVIIIGIGGGGYYLYRTQKTLKTVEGAVSGKDAPKDSSQKPDDMV